MQKITPFLWFNDQAKEAAEFYTSIFPNSAITKVSYYGDGAPMPQGTVMVVSFQLAGQEFSALNGGPHFQLNEAFSMVVNCESQAELDSYWEKLSTGGKQVQCGWLKDKFGLSWQIVPVKLVELISDPDPEKSNRVMAAMMKMIKLDINILQEAYDQA